MNTAEQLTQTFNNNFVAYYRSHVAHGNITGRNFYADHKLLQKIYEDAEANIDTYAEFIRTLYDEMPYTLAKIKSTSDISDDLGVMTDIEYLQMVYDDTETMIATLMKLYEACEEDSEIGLENFVQDRITVHKKLCWQLRATLENK